MSSSKADEALYRQNLILEGINRILHCALTSTTEEELGNVCLEVAEQITESKFGFIGEMNAQGMMVDIAISDPGWDACRMPEHSGHRKLLTELKVHGICGSVVLEGCGFYTNDPSSHPSSIGTPDGHPQLTSFLGAPLIHDGKTIGIVAVGNRVGGYRDEDLRSLETLTPAIVQAFMRRRAEEALRSAHDELEMRVQERIRDLEEVKKAAEAERQRFYDVLETLPAYLVLLTTDYHVPFANRFFRERFGESLGRRCHKYLFGLDEPCEICDTYKVLETNAPHRWEWTGPDGRIYDIYDFPFADSDGSPMIMEMGIDITERRQAEAELAKHRDRLEELVRERTRELERANAQLQSEVAEREEAEEALREQFLTLQRALLPAKPSIGRGYELDSVYIPAFAGEEIGGDFYDVFQTADGRVGILIGDVSGKGTEAASLGAITRSTLRAFAYEASSCGHALTNTNALLTRQQVAEGHFVTVFLAILDPPSGRICCSGAGHPPPALLRADGSVDFLKCGDLPLGVVPEHLYGEGEMQLDPGDHLILYTDGISEARHGAQLFGLDGIESVLREQAGAAPDQICRALLDAARDWAEGRLRDDTAIVVIQRAHKVTENRSGHALDKP